MDDPQISEEGPLAPRRARAPDFGPGDWLNTGAPLSLEGLAGSAVLVDFWDYTRIHCLRALPYVMAWHERYAGLGLRVVGVHTPEFAFGRDRAQVEAALAERGISYPVLLDNEHVTWTRYANQHWPARYLIDEAGTIRYYQHGEGRYRETERAIRTLLRERSPSVGLPGLMEALRPEDVSGAVCYRATQELRAGYRQGALGNPEGYAANHPLVYRLPRHRVEGAFYADGIWRAGEECFAFAGQQGGRLVLPYRAVGVNAVLSPSGDPLEVMLNLRPEAIIEGQQDGAPLAPHHAGEDVAFDGEGVSFVRVDRPRLYALVRNPGFEAHELELTIRSSGLALYTFTFTSCVAPGASPGDEGTLTVGE
jgi:thiol-disulfide isomerase/thioredoxin